FASLWTSAPEAASRNVCVLRHTSRSNSSSSAFVLEGLTDASGARIVSLPPTPIGETIAVCSTTACDHSLQAACSRPSPIEWSHGGSVPLRLEQGEQITCPAWTHFDQAWLLALHCGQSARRSARQSRPIPPSPTQGLP